MRSLKITCAKCKVTSSVPEKFRGQPVRCAGCGKTIQTTPGTRKPPAFKLRAGSPGK